MLSSLTTRHGFRAASLALGALLAIGAGAGSASAQPDKCAALIGKEMRKWAKTGAKNQDKCHKLANKLCLGSEGVCNDPDELAFKIIDKNKYEGTKTKGLAKINESGGACSSAAVVLDQFPGDNVSNSAEFIDDLIANRADAILGDANLACDEANVICFSTISKQRGALADKMFNSALKCQKAVAPGNPLDPSCLDTAPIAGAITSGQAKIAEVCTGITGADIGTCDPLPSCVTDGAIAEGRNAATRAFPDDNCGGTPTADARTASIDISTPTDLGGLTIELDYPRFAMGLPDNGAAINFGDFSNFSVAFLSPFDLDGTLRISAADFNPISSGQFVDVAFDTCKPLTLGSCTVGGAPCNNDLACGGNGPCILENGFCSFSQFINCGDAPLPGCPVNEGCSTQQNLTVCRVVDASDTFGNPVDGVTCTATLTEP